jgi:hypothetical protein
MPEEKENYQADFNLCIVIILISLIVSMPFCISRVIAQSDSGEDVFGGSAITGNAVGDIADILPNVGGKCLERGNRVSGFVDFMDNGVIKTLESVASVMFMICSIMSSIDITINTVYQVIGCCTNPTPACLGEEAHFKIWESFYTPTVKPLCCLVNCGWCTGSGDCMGVLGNVGGFMQKISPASYVPDVKSIPGEEKGIGQFHLSPYDNIYTAAGCMCPVAILFNLRKLKTIYQVYDCCIEEACKAGFSTEGCDKQFDEATCMYWQGSIFKALANVLASIITGFVSKFISDFILKQLPLASCILSALNLLEVPKAISGVKSAWRWMSATFNEPNCKDLGFDVARKNMQAGYYSEPAGIRYLTLIDMDGDGRFDGNLETVTEEVGGTAATTPGRVSGSVPESFVTPTTEAEPTPAKPPGTLNVKTGVNDWGLLNIDPYKYYLKQGMTDQESRDYKNQKLSGVMQTLRTEKRDYVEKTYGINPDELSEEQWIDIGVNEMQNEIISDAMKSYKDSGVDYVRTWAFDTRLPDTEQGWSADSTPEDKLIANEFKVRFNTMIETAEQNNLQVVPVMGNHWASNNPEALERLNSGEATWNEVLKGPETKDTEFYTQGYRGEYLTRVESYVTAYKDSPSIYYWQTINEARSNDFDALSEWSKGIVSELQQIDPDIKVNTGLDGYFRPELEEGDLHQAIAWEKTSTLPVDTFVELHGNEPGQANIVAIDYYDPVGVQAGLDEVKQTGVPVIFSEYGQGKEEYSAEQHVEYVKQVLDFANENGIEGAAIWGVNNFGSSENSEGAVYQLSSFLEGVKKAGGNVETRVALSQEAKSVIVIVKTISYGVKTKADSLGFEHNYLLTGENEYILRNLWGDIYEYKDKDGKLQYVRVTSDGKANSINTESEAVKIAMNQRAVQVSYDLTWKLMDFTLEEFAYGAIDNMCKEDLEEGEYEYNTD